MALKIDPVTGRPVEDDPELAAAAALQARERAGQTHTPAPPPAAATEINQRLTPPSPLGGELRELPKPPAAADADRFDPLASHREAVEQTDAEARARAAAASQMGPDVRSQSTSTRMVPTKAEGQTRKALDQSFDDATKAATAAKNVGVAKAQTEFEVAEAAANETKRLNEEAAKKRETAQKAYQDSTSYLAAEREKVIKAGTRGYWEDQSAGSRVAAALLIGIGGFAKAMSKKPSGKNPVMEVIDQEIERDTAAKKNKVALELEKLGISGKEARERLDLAMLEIKNQHLGALDVAEAGRAARLKKHGADEARVAGDAGIVAIQQRKAQINQEIEAGLRNKVERTDVVDNSRSNKAQLEALAEAASGGDVPVQERMKSAPMMKANSYLRKAINSYEQYTKSEYTPKDEKILRDIVADMQGDKTFDSVEKMRAWKKRVQPRIEKLSPEGQKKFLAGTNFADGVLRDETGAAIASHEQVTKMLGDLFTPGTGAEARMQSHSNALNDMAALGIRAGIPRSSYQELQRKFVAQPGLKKVGEDRYEVPDSQMPRRAAR